VKEVDRLADAERGLVGDVQPDPKAIILGIARAGTDPVHPDSRAPLLELVDVVNRHFLRLAHAEDVD
jgi:hypothetical protein